MMPMRNNASVEIAQRCKFVCSYLVRTPSTDDQPHYYLQPCAYTVDVTVKSTKIRVGTDRVLDFAVLEESIKSVVPDGKFIISCVGGDFTKLIAALDTLNVPIEYVSFEICTENICAWIADMLQARLTYYDWGVIVTSVVLTENGSSKATWRAIQ